MSQERYGIRRFALLNTAGMRKFSHVDNDLRDASDSLERVLDVRARVREELRVFTTPRRGLDPTSNLLETLGQHVQVGAHEGDGIVHLVGDPCSELADRGEVPGGEQPTAQRVDLSKIAKHHDDSDRVASAAAGDRRGKRDGDELAPLCVEQRLPIVDTLADRFDRSVNQIGERPPHQLIGSSSSDFGEAIVGR